MSERYVGIDIGIRTKHRVAVFDGALQRGKSFSVEVSKEGFDKLLSRATKGADGPVHFVFEPTGLAWVPLSAYLGQAGHHLYMAKPQKASDLRKFLRKHTKSDQIDASSLARLPQIDPVGVSEMAVPTAEQTSLRRLVRRRDRMMRRVGRHKQRLHALLVMVHPAYVDAMGSEAFGVASRAFLRRYVDPEKVLRRGPGWLRQFWKKHSKNNAPTDRADDVYESCRKTAELYRGLRKTCELPFDYVAVQEELAEEIEMLEEAEQRASRLAGQMVELHNRLDPGQTLQQLYGVGPVIAAGIEAMVGDIDRFRNARCFVSYTGYCPRKSQTGNSDPSLPITKCGQRLLKMYLYLAAETARRCDPDFAAYYAKRYVKGDHHKRIMVALARKMALRVYALLKRRSAVARGAAPSAASYQLRGPTGQEVSAKEARELIAQRYARKVVAPKRAKRDSARRSKATEAPKSAIGWPPEDATNRTTTPPSETGLSPRADGAKRPGLRSVRSTNSDGPGRESA